MRWHHVCLYDVQHGCLPCPCLLTSGHLGRGLYLAIATLHMSSCMASVPIISCVTSDSHEMV